MNIFKEKTFGDIVAYHSGFGPVGPPLMTVYLYLAGKVLIDTGQRHMHRAICGALSEKRIERILLTHHHEDHIGNAGPLSREHGASVFGHRLAAETMKQGYALFPYQHYIWGKAPPVAVDPFPEVVESDNLRLIPVHTPGHSKDHTVFWEKDRGWLFAGDLYLGDRIKFFRADECFADQIRSLRNVLALDFEWLLCGHNPCLGEGKKHLRCKMNFLEDLAGEIRAWRCAGYSEKAIIRQMADREIKAVKYITLGNVSFANIVRSVLRENREDAFESS